MVTALNTAFGFNHPHPLAWSLVCKRDRFNWGLNQALAFQEWRQSITPRRCSVVEPNCSHDISNPKAFFIFSFPSVAGCTLWWHFLWQKVDMCQKISLCAVNVGPPVLCSAPWTAKVLLTAALEATTSSYYTTLEQYRNISTGSEEILKWSHIVNGSSDYILM